MTTIKPPIQSNVYSMPTNGAQGVTPSNPNSVKHEPSTTRNQSRVQSEPQQTSTGQVAGAGLQALFQKAMPIISMVKDMFSNGGKVDIMGIGMKLAGMFLGGGDKTETASSGKQQGGGGDILGQVASAVTGGDKGGGILAMGKKLLGGILG